MAWKRHRRQCLLLSCLILCGFSVYTMFNQSNGDRNEAEIIHEKMHQDVDVIQENDMAIQIKNKKDMKGKQREAEEIKIVKTKADPRMNAVRREGGEITQQSAKDVPPYKMMIPAGNRIQQKPYQKTIQMRSLYNIPNFNSPEQRKDADLVQNTGVQNIFTNVDSTQFLLSDLAPNTVHYVWCGKRLFQFKHYLSVLSVIKHVQPDMIIMHYEYKPQVDIKKYNQWIWELTHEYPFLTFRKLQGEYSNICMSQDTKNGYVYGILQKYGGIYVEEHTILSEFPFKFRQYDLFSSMMGQGGFLISKPGVLKGQPIQDTFTDRSLSAGHSPCGTYSQFTTNSMQYSCVVFLGTYYPKDIWTLHNAFGRLTRKIMYESEVLPTPQPSYETQVPNIAHMVWMGGGKMDFLFYLSVLSVLHILKAEVLYIHGDKPPTGHYWDMVKGNTRIILIHRDKLQTIYQNAVKSPQHLSDIIRVDIMLKYGGIYCDVDTIWVQPLNPVLRGYDAVAAYDWVYWDPPYPDIINFGVTLGKRGATFWHLFQRSMQYFRSESWGFNGLRQPYKVYEKYPGLLKIEEHLSVICFNFKCHPTWFKNYHNESVNHENTPFDWSKDTFSMHWTDPVPVELRSRDALLKSNTIFGEIGRFVLQEAGLWTQNSK